VPRLRAQPHRPAGFTLIEILAVVLILALLATFVAPNLGALRERRLNNGALQLAAQIELARARSVVTGVPHRVLFDLEDAGYRIEWLHSDEAAAAPALADLDLNGGSPLPLAAPTASDREFEPIPGLYGDFVWLEEPLYIAGLDTAEGWIERGDTFIEFGQDGSAAHTEIVIEDGSGRRIVLAVLPLDDAVRFVDDDEGA
jgi:type II secretion system protein H